jgi:glycosyltransferase involved in cell wall biosynthesis
MIRSLHVDTAERWRSHQNHVLATVTGLEGLGHPTLLVAHATRELKRRAREGLRLVDFTPRNAFDMNAGWQLARLVEEITPDVIHAHDPTAVALAAMALRLKPPTDGPPLLVASRRRDVHLKRQAYSRWTYRRVDVFVAASKSIRSTLVDDGIPADRIETVHDGLDVSLVDKHAAIDVHKTFWMPHGAPVVGTVGRLIPHKGGTHLVAAAALVVRQVPDTRFLILGRGDLRESLERQVKDLGLERHVLFPGFCDDAWGVMRSLDIFVMSSVAESPGGTVLEAMACGCPVVATRVGGIPESVVDGESGLLVPPGDEPALASAIVRLLDDRTLRTRLGAAARRRVETAFSVTAMVQGILDVYERFGRRPGRQ